MALWSQEYEIHSFLVSRQGRLSLYGYLNLLQDTSLAHAAALGHGLRATQERHTLWVLTRQKVSMTAWPAWNDRITIRTWVRPAEGAFAVRDFEVLNSAGVVIGEATTSWLLLNAETRKPIRENISALGFESRDARCSLEAEKVVLRPGAAALARFEVRNSDIDGNQHVNNTRYSQWILDAVPIELHSQHILDTYAVNFLSETRLGDVIKIQSLSEGLVTYFQGVRVSDQKVAFTAELTTHA